MTSLDARLEQIRIRGELLRKQRKKRRKFVLAACIPVILCACVALWRWQPEKPKNTVGSPESDMTLLTEPIDKKVSCGDLVFTDPAHVTSMVDWVQNVTAPKPPAQVCPESNESPTETRKDQTVSGSETESPEDMNNYGPVSDSSQTEISFTVTENQVSVTYILTPTYLINTNTEEQYPISKEEYDTFMEWIL